jgi:YVTN family beta-propeller protein
MTARTTSAALAGLVIAALFAAVSHAASVPTAPHRVEVRGAGTLPSLADVSREVAPLNAIVSQSDTFLVASHGFDDLTGACQDRGWVGEDRTGQVYAHVSSDKTVNQAFFGGLPSAGSSLPGRASTTGGIGRGAIAVTDSGAVICGTSGYSIGLVEVYPGQDIIRLYNNVYSTMDNMPEALAFNPATHEVVACVGTMDSGLWANNGPGYWHLLGGLGSEWIVDTTLAAARIYSAELTVDTYGNIYYVDGSEGPGNGRVRMVRVDGRVITLAGIGNERGYSGDGGPALLAHLNRPSGLVVDDSGTTLYIADTGNHRVRGVDLGTGIIRTVCGDGTTATLPNPLDVGFSGGSLFISNQDGRIYKFSAGELSLVCGGSNFGPTSGFSSPAQNGGGSGRICGDGSGGIYFTGRNLLFHLDAGGTLTTVAGMPVSMAMGTRSLWFGADPGSHSEEVANWVVPSGYGNGWSQRVTSVPFSYAAHPGAVLRFDGSVHLASDAYLGPPALVNAGVMVQGLNTSGTWTTLTTRLKSGSGDSTMIGPFIGRALFNAEVHLDADGNQNRQLAPNLQLRLLVQTEATGSSEDGLGPDAPDGALVVDNLTLRDGDLDLIPPTDFEDGTTGAWTISALNGAYRMASFVTSWTRDFQVAPTDIGLQKGFDFTDPGCVWTFLAAGDTVNHRGLYARVTSPWLPMAPGTTPADTQLVIAFSGKLGNLNSGRQLVCWVRGKNAGDTHPHFASPTYFALNSGTWGDDVASPYLNQRLLNYPGDFQYPMAADSVQIVFYAEDVSETQDPFTFPAGVLPLSTSKLPYLDDIRVYQLNVDRDHDGVADALDACPDSCAAGQDADGDGCVDATATMRHVESWDRDALPLHYEISAHGSPLITDNSDVAAITNGFAAWAAVPGAALQVVQDGLVAQTSTSAYDGVNLVTFEDDYSFPSNVIGVTPTLSALRRAAYDDRIVLPGQIVDSDMLLNPQVPFRTPSYDPGANAIDLQSVVTHEAGHFFGLTHSGVLNSTMFFVLQPGQGAASLEADDRAAIAAAYPGPTFAADFATITGRVVRGGTGYAVPGALVTAVQLDGGVPADSAASDYTDEGGNYALRGLAPGSYSVRITPLDGEMGGYALTPDYISDRLAAVAQTNFPAEWWSEPDTDRDPPDLRGALTLAAGELRSGLDVITNVDTIAPRVVSIAPGRDTVNVRIDTSILVNFSERIDPNTLQGGLRLHPVGVSTALGGKATLVNGARSLVFTSTDALLFGTQYQIDVTTALADRNGVHVAEEFTTHFTTEPAPPVTITDIQPRSAARGSFVTIIGTSFDPAGTDSVELPMPSAPGYVRGAPASVTPTSMLVRVPFFVSSGPVRVYVNGDWSNSFGLTILPYQPISAPSPVSEVALSFPPTDVAVSPDGARAFAVGSGGLAEIDLSTLAVTYSGIGDARTLAVRSNGDSLVITRPASGDVVVVDARLGSGTRGQIVGTTTLPDGATPSGVALDPAGRNAFVTDPALHVVYRIDTDPRSATRNQVVGEVSDSAAALSGGIAVTPQGAGVLYGTLDAGAHYLTLPGNESEALNVPSNTGGVAVAPGGVDALLAGTGAGGSSLTVVSPMGSTNPWSGPIFLGGEVRDVIFGPDGKSAYAVNSVFNQIQMVSFDSTVSYQQKVAEVATGSTPVAIAVSGFGNVLAVANYGSRSVSVYHTGGTTALVRALPSVARPGDVVALQGTGAPFGAGSQVDVGAGPFAPERLAPGGNGAAFVVPLATQRDASVAAVDSLGARTLGLPLRIVDPITSLSAREAGFGVMLDSLAPVAPEIFEPTSFKTMRISPDGKLIAVVRAAAGLFGQRLEFVGVEEDGVNRLGPRLHSRSITSNSDEVLGMAFTADGKRLWTCSTSWWFTVVDADPASPTFGQDLASWLLYTWGPGPIATDPLGRYMIVGKYSSDSLSIYSPTGAPLTNIDTRTRAEAIAVSPDGRWVVSAGGGAVDVIDLDALAPLASPATHAQSAHDYDIAIPLDGKRAVVKYPDLSIGIYNLDPAAGAVGTELYYGAPLAPGTPVRDVAPAPDGHSVLLSRPGAALALLDPSVIPPGVTYPATQRWVGPMVISPDGRRLWTEGGAGTTRDSLRLVNLSPASSLVLVSGGGQSGLTNRFLAQPLRFRATDGNGNPQVGAVLRFDGVRGLKPILDNWDTPLWHVTDVNGEVSVRWMVSSVPGTDSLVVQVLGSSYATTLATAQVVVADDQLQPAVLSLGPVDGAAGLNAGTAVSATFNKAMDSTSVAAHLKLHAGPNLIAGAFRTPVGGKTFIFQPSQPLAYAARCSLVVESGIADTFALATSQGLTSVFTIQSPPALAISSLTPPAGTTASPVVISGEGFNPVPSQNTVLFNGVLATVTSATATSIVANVPLAATTGGVTVQSGSSTSNSLNFVVLDPNASPGGVINTLPAGQGVRDVAITSDGLRAYVTNPASNSVTALDIPGAQTITSVTVGLQPQGVALLPDDSRAYVANTGSNDVRAIDIRPASADYHKVVATIPVGSGPVDIAVSAIGPTVIVVNSGSNDVSLIHANPGDATFDQVTTTVNTGSGGRSVTVRPDGTEAFVATAGGTVVGIDLLTGAVTSTVNTGSGGRSVTVKPDGTILLVLCDDGTLKVIDISPGSPTQYQVTASVNTGSGGRSVTVKPDGALAYVTSEDGNTVLVYAITAVSITSASSISPGPSVVLTLIATIPVGQGPAGIAVDPSHGAFALVCNAASGTVSIIGLPTSLPPVALDFDLSPNTLNLKSMGNWVTGHLEPRPPRTAAEIVLGSILLNGIVPADTSGPHAIGDEDGDGVPDLMVKFSRRAVSLTVPDGDRVPVTVTGTVGPRLFTGTDTIRVKRARITAPVAHEVVPPGHPYSIRWEVPKDVRTEWVAVLHTFDRGETWALDATHLPNTGSFVWNVPLAVGDSVRVAVVLVESADSTGFQVTGVLGQSEPFEVFGTTDVEPAPAALSFEPIRPNPALGEARMRFGLPRAAEVKLEVFDLQGRRVRTLATGLQAAGWHDVSWKGQMEGGARSGAGLYFVRFRAEGREFRERLVWLR